MHLKGEMHKCGGNGMTVSLGFTVFGNTFHAATIAISVHGKKLIKWSLDE